METTLLALFFISLATGMTIASFRFFSKLGQYTCVLLCSLVIGVMASKCGADFSKLQSAMASLKSLLFLLFIFATGYVNGPAMVVLFRKLTAGPVAVPDSSDRYQAVKVVFVSLTVFISAGLTVLCMKYILRDDSLLGAVAAGSLTQTAILGLTADAKAGVISRGLNREVVFTLTYLTSTVATMFFCSHVIPLLSTVFGKKHKPLKAEDILRTTAEELKETGENTAISFKFSPVPDRVGRAFTVKENMPHRQFRLLKEQLASEHITLQCIFTPEGVVKNTSDEILPGDIAVTLGERRSMEKASGIIGRERLDIPRRWQKNFHFASMSIFLKTSLALSAVRAVCNDYNMCLEQIIAPDGKDIDRDVEIMLPRGTKIKLFGIMRDMYEIAGRLGKKNCFVIPKDKNTGIALLSFSIFAAIMVAMIPGFSLLGSGLFAFIFGIVIGSLREYLPLKYFGFPPQASQLFQTFGLGGYLALAGLGAADNIMNVSANGLGTVLVGAVVIWLLPLLSGAILALRLFQNNAATASAAVAGARSSNVAYDLVSKMCAGNGKMQLETAFSISYAVANIFLNLIGLIVIGKGL